MRKHRHKIEAIALALQERETLTEDEVKTIMNRS
jgi:ATP-dependent Zn protease